VEAYDLAEQGAIPGVGNRIIASSRPGHFMRNAYPDTVREEAELGRYVDVMHEGRFDAYIESLGGLTHEEFALFRRINESVAAISEQRYGRKRVVGAALLSSIYIFRHLRALYAPGATIFDLGPGCGYLGALLVLSGYSYLASDVSQAFYVYQNHLLNAVTGGKVIELATDARALREITELEPGAALHIPWWKYVVPEQKIRLPLDCVSPNHMLCEMSNVSLSFNLRVWTDLGITLVFDSWGSGNDVPAWLVAKRLTEAGFVFAYSDGRLNVVVPNDAATAVGALRLPNTERTPSEEFYSLRQYGESGFQRAFRPPVYRDQANVLGRKIMEHENALRAVPMIGAAEIRSFLMDLRGEPTIETDDEMFMRFVGVGAK